MNAMTIAQGIDMEAFHAQQEDALKKMTKGKLISYVGKLEAELTAYRHQVQTLTTENQNLTTNEELRETAIQGLKEEIDALQTSLDGSGIHFLQLAELQKEVDDKKTRLAYVEGKLAINTNLLKVVCEERDDLKGHGGQWQKMRDILDEAEEKNLIFYRDHEYCFNGDIPASWSDESFEGRQAAASHLEGYHKLLRVIHEADPITGMW
jgi:predicted  nucleic acid-binding Zn-ribbon protein